MRGQWFGSVNGDYEGAIVLNVDEFSDHFAGRAHVMPHSPALPASVSGFRTNSKSNVFSIRAFSDPVSRETDLPIAPNDFARMFPGVTFSPQADVNGQMKDGVLTLDIKTALGTKLSAQLNLTGQVSASQLQSTNKSWSDYKEHVLDLCSKGYSFRGQRQPWKLRTLFHRSKRYDVSRFMEDDIHRLHRHLSARTKHVFDLALPLEKGAFVSLVQHHGYPTPLLDWTESPFVAAFFAFRKAGLEPAEKDHVRIYMLDQLQWKKDVKQRAILDCADLHVSLFYFLAIENERLIPQQAITTASNVDDIEAHFHAIGDRNGRQYLTAIDIPLSERTRAMNELAYMGITAGSMFPGLDGACEELRERLFAVP